MLDLAVEAGIVDKSGAWYAYQENKIGQGKENAKLFLVNNPDVLMEIEEQVRECYGFVPKEKQSKSKKSKEEKTKEKDKLAKKNEGKEELKENVES